MEVWIGEERNSKRLGALRPPTSGVIRDYIIGMTYDILLKTGVGSRTW
jgi:hypothetical protein